MDVLSDVLNAVRLTGAVFFDVTARSPWVAETPPTGSIAPSVMPEAEHVIAFHIVTRGPVWVEMPEGPEPPRRLNSGDVVIFPKGNPHVFCSEVGMRAEPDLANYYRPTDRQLPFILKQNGGGREEARFVCGYLGCDARPFNPLLDALPPMLHAQSTDDRGSLVADLVALAVEETKARRTGGEIMLAKLSELLFVQSVRDYIDGLPDDSVGWLSGLRDRHVSAALSLIHGQPEQDWTLDRLSRKVGLSRSSFAERFTHYMDVSPMRYLGRWRMQLAAGLLKRPGMSVAEAGTAVGYHSEAAFNRAFKKVVGAPPGEWRRGQNTHVES